MIIEQPELQKILPQAYPFVLIDRVEDVIENESLVAVKNITANDWCFEGDEQAIHYPETLIIEAAAQAALVLYHVSKVKSNNPKKYLIGKSVAEFLAPARVGDQLKITVKAGKLMDSGGFCDAETSVDSTAISNLNFIFKVSDG